MELVMQTKPDFCRPLYLRILCEELRLHGEFGFTGELVIRKINELHGTIDLLFGDVLERLERNHGPQLVGDALSLLYCARGGLLEKEILALLAPPGVKQLPRRLSLNCRSSPAPACCPRSGASQRARPMSGMSPRTLIRFASCPPRISATRHWQTPFF